MNDIKCANCPKPSTFVVAEEEISLLHAADECAAVFLRGAPLPPSWPALRRLRRKTRSLLTFRDEDQPYTYGWPEIDA